MLRTVDNDLSQKIRRMSFLSAMFVVAIHNTYRINEFDSLPKWFSLPQLVLNCGITRTAVPFFFVFAGYFLFRDYDRTEFWWLNKIKTRFVTLAIPYCTWIAIGIMQFLIINHFRQSKEIINWSSWQCWLEVLGITSAPTCMFHFWFVRILLLVVLWAPIVGWIVKRFKLGSLLLLFATALWMNGGCAEHFLFVMIGAQIAINGVSDRARSIINGRASLFFAGMLWCLLITVNVLIFADVVDTYFWMKEFLFIVMNISGMIFL